MSFFHEKRKFAYQEFYSPIQNWLWNMGLRKLFDAEDVFQNWRVITDS